MFPGQAWPHLGVGPQSPSLDKGHRHQARGCPHLIIWVPSSLGLLGLRWDPLYGLLLLHGAPTCHEETAPQHWALSQLGPACSGDSGLW